MKKIDQQFPVSFTYEVFFTEHLFRKENPLFADLLQSVPSSSVHRIFFAIDDGVAGQYPRLSDQIAAFIAQYPELMEMAGEPVIIPGGEAAKNDSSIIEMLHRRIHEEGLDRHCFVVAIGGGAVLDAVGYAAATAHRGIRLIRVPTTVLAQNDAGIGVKNGVNAFGKKNFLGTFAPPFAVINDFSFLHTLDSRDWRAGISEAVKVALIKDRPFFAFLEEHAAELGQRAEKPMHHLIQRCAELHLEHIATSGDPFETGSSRPLDFGHWSAHKLEQLTDFKLRHGEAVAVGIALDVTYAYLCGMIKSAEWQRVLDTLKSAGFTLFVPELKQQLSDPAHEHSIFHGLEEFREHLGGELTIMLLEGIGRGKEVHEVDYAIYRQAIEHLENFHRQSAEMLNS